MTQAADEVAGNGNGVQRSAASEVSPSVTSVTVDYTSPSIDDQAAPLTSRNFHRVVAGSVVKRIVAALNGLSVPFPGAGMCARDDGQLFLLSMDNAGSSLSFRLTGQCRRVVAIADGHLQPALLTSPELDSLIASAVGAPPVNW